MDKDFYPLLLKNLLTFVRNSVGSESFRNLYFHTAGEETDILRGGKLSCAFFVSSALKIFSLIGNIHATVAGTMHDLIASGWTEASEAEPGNVIVWQEQELPNGERHRHIGICVEDGRVISNSSETGLPSMHAWDFRSVDKIFKNPNLV